MYSPATAPAATALSAEETLVSAKAKLAKQFSGDFDPRLSAIYIEPQGAERSNAPEAQTFPLLQEAAERLTRSPLRSLLLLGDSGMGKTCLSLHFCKKVWQWIDAGIPGLPLPLYIYLPQYKEYLHRGLLDQVLIEAKLTKAERHTLIEQPLLLILDGFDEVSIRENLYQTQGWGKRGVDIKILVTCRPEALVNQNPQALFEADELFGQNTAYFNTMYLQDFNENQIESYLSSYLKRSQSDGDEPRLSLRDYLDWLGRLPSLKALVSTPFLLTVVAQALPRIIEGLSSASPDEIAHKKLTQNAVFRHFLDHWFLKQAQRVKAQGKLKELSAEEVAGYMRAFAQNLASTRMRIDEGQLDEAPLKEEECLRLELIEPVHDKALLTLYRHVNPQKAQWRVFFSEDSQGQKIPHIDNIQAIRSGCLLHTVGEQFKFLHKSITEYLAAQELMEGVLGTSDHYLTTLLGEDGHAQGLNRVLLTKEPQMIKRLAEAANEYPDFKEALNKILLASKEISGLSIAAANAITILNYAGVDFSGRDLSEVQIPGADLTSGIFYGTNLSGANLANVILRQTYLSYADFRGSNLSNIEFGERPYWQVSSCIRCIAAYQASPDILHWLIGCRNGYVYRIDHHSGKQLAQLVHKDFFDSAKELLDFGYKEAVNALSIHSPSHLLATGGDNSKIWLWDLRNNKTLGCLTQHDEAIDAIVITSDGKVLVSASRWSDLTMILWSMPQGTPIRVLTSESIGDVCALAITPDVKTLISASRRTLQLWFLPEGTPGPVLCKNTYSSDKEINALVVTPNGKTLISGSKDVIQFWSLPEGTSGLALRGHTEKINTLVVTSDGKTLISVGEETFRLWSLSDGTLQLVVSKGRSWVTAANITSDGKTLVAGVDTTVRLWSICQQTFGPILVGHTGKINSLAITPDAKILISAGGDDYNNDSIIRLWFLPEGSVGPALNEYTKYITALIITPDGKTLIVGCKDGCWGQVRLRTLPELKVNSIPPKTFPYRNSRQISSDERAEAFAVTPDGKILIVGSQKGYGKKVNIRLWSLPEGVPDKLILKAYTKYIFSLAVTPDGKTLISAGSDRNILGDSNKFKLWSLPDGTPGPAWSGYTSWINTLVITPNGQTLISAGSDQSILGEEVYKIKLWSLPDGDPGPILSGHTDSIKALVIMPNGETLISGSRDNTIRLWCVPEGKCLCTVDLGFSILSLLVQGNQLFIGGEDGTLLSLRLEPPFYSNWNPLINWIKRGSAKLSLHHTELHGALNLSSEQQLLCEQQGAIGKPNPISNTSYQAWCTLFQSIPSTAHFHTQLSLIGTEDNRQSILLPLSEDNWVLSVARKVGGAKRSTQSTGFFSFFRNLTEMDNASHSFLILEGLKQNRRFIIRAELIVETRASQVKILLRSFDDLLKFRDSASEYEANQFQITAEEGNTLLRNVRRDQWKKINYSLLGDSQALSSSSSSSLSEEVEMVETHNCLSWCCKHVGLIGQEIKRDRWYNFFITLPSDVTRPGEAANQAEPSSSFSLQMS